MLAEEFQPRKSIVTAKFIEDKPTDKSNDDRPSLSEDKPFYEPSKAYYLLLGEKPEDEAKDKARPTSGAAFTSDLEDVITYEAPETESSDSSYAPPPSGYEARRKTAFGGEIVKEFEKDVYSESSEEDIKVKINLPKGMGETKSQIKRRPTGFIKKSELPPIEDDEDDEGRVRIKDDPNAKQDPQKIKRRQTAYFAGNIFQLLEQEEEEYEEEEEEEQEKQEEPPVPDGGRKTDFATEDDLEKVKVIERLQKLEEYEEYGEEFEYYDEIDYEKHVCIDPDAMKRKHRKILRRPTGFVKLDEVPNSQLDLLRKAVASRLHEDTLDTADTLPPTLKNYRPISERIPYNLLLTFNLRKRILAEETAKLKEEKEVPDYRKPTFKSSLDKLPKLPKDGEDEPSTTTELRRSSIDKYRKSSIDNVFSKASIQKFRPSSVLSVKQMTGKSASKKDLNRRTSFSENMMLNLEPVSAYNRPVMTIETYRRVNERRRRQFEEEQKEAKQSEKCQRRRIRSSDKLPEITIANKVYSLRRP